MIDRSHDTRNTATRERLRVLVDRLDDTDLARPLGEGWSVAVALAHLAAWDRGVLATLDAWQPTGFWPPFAGAEAMNAIGLPSWQTTPHRAAAQQAVEAAEEVDARIRALPDAATAIILRENPRLLDRSNHRRAHLDEIEHALATTKTPPDEP